MVANIGLASKRCAISATETSAEGARPTEGRWSNRGAGDMSLRTASDDNMFRALVAFPAADVQTKTGMTTKQSKEAWETAQRAALNKCMDHFLTTKSVKPYPMYAVDPDKAYLDLCHRNGTKVDIDNAIEELNEGYKSDGLLFLPQKAKGCTKTDTRLKPAKLTKSYAYSTANPDGYFSDYLFPIFHSFGGVSTNASKLCHRGYGTMHDMLEIGDVDLDACFLPSVLFIAWDEQPSARAKTPKRTYDIIERGMEDVTTDTEWAKLISDTMLERIGRHGIIAMAECKL